MSENSVFRTLAAVETRGKVEEKNGLKYLSWVYAWAETVKRYPDATYKVKRSENGLPYHFDANTGYMVFTEVTIQGLTHEMWLPVMDGANKAMTDQSYTYKVKDWNASRAQGCDVFKDKEVASATMFDVNKTIMRCLVKNLAMFGLGINVYAGEDLPLVQELPSADTIKGWMVGGWSKDQCIAYIENMAKDNGLLIESDYREMVDSI